MDDWKTYARKRWLLAHGQWVRLSELLSICEQQRNVSAEAVAPVLMDGLITGRVRSRVVDPDGINWISTEIAEHGGWHCVDWFHGRIGGLPIEAHWPSVEAALANETKLCNGAPGRPTNKHLIEAELERRIEAGTVQATCANEARELQAWFREHYPAAPSPSTKTIQNAIRRRHRAWREDRKPETPPEIRPESVKSRPKSTRNPPRN